MDDYYCESCREYRIEDIKGYLVCLSCADMVWPLVSGNSNYYSPQPLSRPRCGFKDFLDFFAGMDSKYAPKFAISMVMGLVPDNFTEPEVNAALSKRYSKFSKDIYEVLIAVKEARSRNVANISQVRVLLKDLKLQKHNQVAGKIMLMACPRNMRFFTAAQEDDILYLVDKARDAFEVVRSKGEYFPRFQYLLYKVCELLDLKQFHQDITIPGKRSLKSNDIMWAKICRQAGLEFHPTC